MYIYELDTKSDNELRQILSKDNIYNAKYLIDNNNCIYKSFGHKYRKLFAQRINSDVYPKEYDKNSFKPLTYNKYKSIQVDRIYSTINGWPNSRYKKFIANKFIEYFGEDKVDYIPDRGIVIIYFPKITIENSAEQTHTMRDVYLVISINHGIKLEYLYRATKTYGELNTNYNYSHSVGFNSSYNYSNSFCFGLDTPIRKIIENMNSRASVVKNISMFFPLLEEYLKWESIEGTPYCYINNILDKRWMYDVKINKTPDNISEITNTVIKNLDSFEYDHILNDDVYTIRLSNSDEKIKNILEEYYPELLEDTINGQCIAIKDGIKDKYNTHIGTKVLDFKGSPVLFNIYDDCNPSELNIVKTIPENIVRKVREVIDTLFTNYLINKKCKK